MPFWERGAEGAGGGDVDCMVEGLDPLWPLHLSNGWRLCQVLHYDLTGWYWVLERDGQILAVDTLEDPRGVGKYGFPTRRAYWPDPSDPPGGLEAAYLVAKRIRKRIVAPSDWQRIAEFAQRDWADFERGLIQVFGRRMASRLSHVVGAATPPSASLLKTARRVQFLRRIRTPGRAGLVGWMWLHRVVGRIARPTGLFVVVVGPDGSGKSHVAKEILERTKALFRRQRHFHWRPGLLPRPGALVGSAPSDPTRPHDRPKRAAIPSLFMLAYYWFDFFLGSWLRLMPFRARTGLIVSERGWWDMAVDRQRYRIGMPAGFIRWLGRLLPQPDLVLILEAPPAVLHARKAELALEELDRQTREWRRVLPRHIPRAFVDTDRPIQDVVESCYEQIAGALERRALRRLGPGWVSLPSQGSPRWQLPRGPRGIAKRALRIYQPMTLRGRVAWEVSRVAASCGLFRLLPRGQAPDRAVIRELGPLLGLRSSVAISAVNRRGRFIGLELNSDSGEKQKLVKIATDPTDAAVIAGEARALNEFGSLLSPPLRAPRLIDASANFMVEEAVEFMPRARPWILPEEVAHSLGQFWAMSANGSQIAKLAHGDVAPWNLLKSGSDWVLIDWEHVFQGAPVFYDLWHYVIQAHVLLGKPSLRAIREGLDGRGWVGRAITAYARGARVPIEDAHKALPSYLESSKRLLNPDTPDWELGTSMRDELKSLLAP